MKNNEAVIFIENYLDGTLSVPSSRILACEALRLRNRFKLEMLDMAILQQVENKRLKLEDSAVQKVLF